MNSFREHLNKRKEYMAFARELPEYVHEQYVSGDKTYFHGSDSLCKLQQLDAKQYGNHKCLFFTSHFGYAMSYAFPIGSTDKYKSVKDFARKIQFSEQIHPRRAMGYIYPIKLTPRPFILDLNSPADARRMASLIWKNKLGSNLKTASDIDALASFMRDHDWLALDYKANVPGNAFEGVTRDRVLELLHSDPEIIGFSCYEQKFSPGDFGYPAIGIFQDKIPEWLKQNKPLRVVYIGNENAVAVENIE
jgi:hypothetical protein